MSFARPMVMGVLNVTPDSFSDGGQFIEPALAVAQARILIDQGANIIDIGGESTRPGAERVPLEIEQARVLPVISALYQADWFAKSSAIISIDTMNSATAAAAVAAGAEIVNDVSGGLADPQMFATVASSKTLRGNPVRFIISHWRGFSNVMNSLATYEDVAVEVAAELAEQVSVAVAHGVAREQIVIDPGLGFAKDMKQNWQLVARLDEVEKLGLPILVGASRKRFIAGALDEVDPGSVDVGRRDVATAVLTALLLQRKLWGIRVHNVQNTMDAISVVQALRLAETEIDSRASKNKG
jgi:dihydropteroate synthase